MESINLNLNFSTTRRIKQQQPNIESNPSSKVSNLLFLPSNPERQGEGGLRTQDYFKCNQQDNLPKNLNETDSSKNHSTLPLVTIVTVVFNGKKYLEQTIQSVINQTYDNVEYIIIDGGSTDGTLDIIRKYEKVIDYWVSEPDAGIYDAMNKGINLASGDLIELLNSGDIFTSSAVEEVVKIYIQASQNNEYLVIGGLTYRFDEENNIQFLPDKNKEIIETKLNNKINWAMPINHQSIFVSRSVYEKLGLLNIQLKICADYDFVYRAYHSSFVKFIFTDCDLVYYRLGGVSERFGTLWNMCVEHFLIRKEKLSLVRNLITSCHWLAISTFKRFFKSILNHNIMSVYYNLRHGKVISNLDGGNNL